MPKFKLGWSETYDFEALVEADNLDEAIEKFKGGEIDFPPPEEGTYVDGTSELNTSWINEVNDPITGVKEGFE